MWTKCLFWSVEQKSGLGVKLFVDTFHLNQLMDAPIFVLEDFCNGLFELIEISLTQPFMDDGVFSSLVCTVSNIFKHFYSAEDEEKAQAARPMSRMGKPRGVMIDSKYCDNEKFSDIRFIVDGKTIFAHRIALVNSSDEFENFLQNSDDLIHIDDISYMAFKALIEFVYGKHLECMQRISEQPIQNQLLTIDSAKHYGLHELCERIVEHISRKIDCATCIPVFVYACVSNPLRVLKETRFRRPIIRSCCTLRSHLFYGTLWN
jgi:hypothetical protein